MRKIVRKQTTEFHGCGGGRGRSQSPEYRAWAQMIARCENPRELGYKNYGGRGIRVCPRWRESFAEFLSDMGRRPSDKHSIDRIDNNGGYEPSNCRWATRAQQNANHRGNHLVLVDGITEPLTHACKRHGLGIAMIRNRMKRGGLTAAEAIAMGASRRPW
jgi:hypothetical protein